MGKILSFSYTNKDGIVNNHFITFYKSDTIYTHGYDLEHRSPRTFFNNSMKNIVELNNISIEDKEDIILADRAGLYKLLGYSSGSEFVLDDLNNDQLCSLAVKKTNRQVVPLAGKYVICNSDCFSLLVDKNHDLAVNFYKDRIKMFYRSQNRELTLEEFYNAIKGLMSRG